MNRDPDRHSGVRTALVAGEGLPQHRLDQDLGRIEERNTHVFLLHDQRYLGAAEYDPFGTAGFQLSDYLEEGGKGGILAAACRDLDAVDGLVDT